jgi:hypothetical protein
VKAAQLLGGLVVVAIIILAVWSGLTTGQGSNTAHSFGDSLLSLWDWTRERFGTLGTGRLAGNAAASAVLGLALFAALVIFVPAARNGRGLVVNGLAALALGVLVFQPTLIGR